MKNTFTYFILLFLGFNNLFGQLVPYEEPLLIQDPFIQNNIHTYSIAEDDINQILNLTIYHSSNIINFSSICDGDSYYIGNSVYTLPGSYTDVLISINGFLSNSTGLKI